MKPITKSERLWSRLAGDLAAGSVKASCREESWVLELADRLDNSMGLKDIMQGGGIGYIEQSRELFDHSGAYEVSPAVIELVPEEETTLHVVSAQFTGDVTAIVTEQGVWVVNEGIGDGPENVLYLEIRNLYGDAAEGQSPDEVVGNYFEGRIGPAGANGSSGRDLVVSTLPVLHRILPVYGGMPVTTESDSGKVLAVDESGAYILVPFPLEIPVATTADEGKTLSVLVSGNTAYWGLVDMPTELPVPTAEDEGKVLTVNNGLWRIDEIPSSNYTVSVLYDDVETMSWIVDKTYQEVSDALADGRNVIYRVTNERGVCTTSTTSRSLSGDISGFAVASYGGTPYLISVVYSSSVVSVTTTQL